MYADAVPWLSGLVSCMPPPPLLTCSALSQSSTIFAACLQFPSSESIQGPPGRHCTAWPRAAQQVPALHWGKQIFSNKASPSIQHCTLYLLGICSTDCTVLLVHHRSLKVYSEYCLLPMCCWCGQIALLGPGTDTEIREHTRMKRSVRQLFIVKMLLKRLKILYTSHTAKYKL